VIVSLSVAVVLFGLSYSISLIAVVAGIAVKKTGKYLIPLYAGWVLTIVDAGLLMTLHADSNFVKAVGFQVSTLRERITVTEDG